MKRVLKTVGRVFIILLIAALALLLGAFVFDKIMLVGDAKLLAEQQIGQRVEVDGRRMSVYASGEGRHTLVFMSGSGASSPILDYRPFAERFADDYQTVIIEKFGYGFSDGFDGPRDVETRVRQNREALQAAGINGPYILCPHSYSGLEAIYWAQHHPDEVEAIIGLDMAVPGAYAMYDEEIISSIHSSDAFKRTLRSTGLVRLFVGSTIPEDFSEEEKRLLTAIICSTYGNPTASREADYILPDLEALDRQQAPDIPTLLLLSDGRIAEGWIDFAMDYASSLSNVTTVRLDCGHSVHKHEPERCENAMREFLAQLDTD